jgi:pimeloyl-ACP methyl ester carboxylesterase
MSKVTSLAGASAPGKRPAVIALHCSGSSGRQWNKLAQRLGDRFNFIAPDLIGSGATPGWNGTHRFRLADEAARMIGIIDALDVPIHLVGHSYGGGVALRIARERPARVASLSLYEPSAFHVLRSLGPDGRSALAEIRSVAGDVAHGVIAGDYRTAARRFVDYWNGEGTWSGAKPESQTELARYVPKATLEFGALIEEPTPLVAYRRFACPVLLMRGARGPVPTALIAQKLFSIVRGAVIEEIPDAGHMGPFSHADLVSDMIAAHVAAAAGFDRSAEQEAFARLRAAA